MTPEILNWLRITTSELVKPGDVVYEVGALNINGSARDVLQKTFVDKWVGFDYQDGPGVDAVVPTGVLFGPWFMNNAAYSGCDVFVSCEALEHDADPYGTLQAMRSVLKPGGYMVITTPGKSFPYHAYPYDYFRVGADWMRNVAFAGYNILALEEISAEPYKTLVGLAQKI